jgi:signal transduction histidine kinase
MPDSGGRDLLSEWQKAMDSVLGSAASIGGAAAIPRQLLQAVQRQLELVQELIDRERQVQRQVAGQLLAPVDAVFDLLDQSSAMLRSQAEALETAGRALEETARLANIQAQLFERTISVVREPAERARTALGIERQVPKGRSKQPPRSRSRRGK